jgi:hypothetical protein
MAGARGDLAAALRGALPDLCDRIVTAVRAQNSSYKFLDLAVQRANVERDMSTVVEALVQRRAPETSDHDVLRQHARMRAQAGVPIEDLVSAYHIGFRLLWEIVFATAGGPGPDASPWLADSAGLLWRWLQMFSSVTADGYADDAGQRRIDTDDAIRRLVKVLAGPTEPDQEVRGLARRLGFDPQGWFQVVRAPAPPERHPILAGLDRRLASCPGAAHRLIQAGHLTVLLQGPAEPVLEVLDGLPGAGAGCGLRRRFLGGAARSLADADRALALSRVLGRTVFFEEDWLFASLLPHLDRLAPLLVSAPAVASADDQEHLREAVRAYARAGFSLASAGQQLGIHANTMRYRLQRWEQITGWDPRSLPGLRLSLLLDLSLRAGDAVRNRPA